MRPPYIQGKERIITSSCWPNNRIRVGVSGPDWGISRSVLKRTHYLAYLAGANFIALEEWRDVLKIWDFEQKKTVFSPRGKIYCEFADFVRNHPDRGAHYSPVAICVPIAQGYPTWGGSPFGVGKFGYTDGDKAIDAVVYTLVCILAAKLRNFQIEHEKFPSGEPDHYLLFVFHAAQRPVYSREIQ